VERSTRANTRPVVERDRGPGRQFVISELPDGSAGEVGEHTRSPSFAKRPLYSPATRNAGAVPELECIEVAHPPRCVRRERRVPAKVICTASRSATPPKSMASPEMFNSSTNSKSFGSVCPADDSAAEGCRRIVHQFADHQVGGGSGAGERSSVKRESTVRCGSVLEPALRTPARTTTAPRSVSIDPTQPRECFMAYIVIRVRAGSSGNRRRRAARHDRFAKPNLRLVALAALPRQGRRQTFDRPGWARSYASAQTCSARTAQSSLFPGAQVYSARVSDRRRTRVLMGGCGAPAVA